MCSSFRSFRERKCAKGRHAAIAGAVASWVLYLLAEISDGSGVVPLKVAISITKALSAVISRVSNNRRDCRAWEKKISRHILLISPILHDSEILNGQFRGMLRDLLNSLEVLLLELEVIDASPYLVRFFRQHAIQAALQQCIAKFGEELDFFMITSAILQNASLSRIEGQLHSSTQRVLPRCSDALVISETHHTTAPPSLQRTSESIETNVPSTTTLPQVMDPESISSRSLHDSLSKVPRLIYPSASSSVMKRPDSQNHTTTPFAKATTK